MRRFTTVCNFFHQGDHIHLEINLNDLAALYYTQGKYETATPYYRRSIEMYKRLFSELSYLAVVMSNFAALLREEGSLEEAEKFQSESLAMHRKLTGGRRY
ncbi:tetratricopeptide repeat protein [Aliifodinibius sp. S!AR15-10]|uniref:tetratricopeptide repeat protein n=1 Tax=Aliifodinibius sp. S!AR15-10 TaxID=2950437 RepID=UPI002859812E|nr:tetratricopeptide repeat protein [Aliifodinibius sp. S!AR15-10]MDR8391096.1 tetratricopeptide repeat protein [Aliifodinibius sp. S!AR15-10]